MGLFVIWSVLALATVGYIAVDQNASRKRLLWPILVCGISGLFLGLLWATGTLTFLSISPKARASSHKAGGDCGPHLSGAG